MELIWKEEKFCCLRWYTPLQTVDWCEDEVREWRLYLVEGDLCGEMSTWWRQLPPLALFLAPLTNSSGCERPLQLGAEKIHYPGIKHARWEQFGVRVCVSTYHVCPNQYSEALTELYCRYGHQQTCLKKLPKTFVRFKHQELKSDRTTKHTCKIPHVWTWMHAHINTHQRGWHRSQGPNRDQSVCLMEKPFS